MGHREVYTRYWGGEGGGVAGNSAEATLSQKITKIFKLTRDAAHATGLIKKIFSFTKVASAGSLVNLVKVQRVFMGLFCGMEDEKHLDRVKMVFPWSGITPGRTVL